MVKIRPLGVIKTKWRTKAEAARADYEFGVKNPLEVWEEQATKAGDTWADGVTKAAAEKRYERGVRGKQAKWQKRAVQVGPGRFTEGVRIAEEDYSTGFADYHAEIERIELPVRRPRGDPANLERVRVMMDALHKKRIAKLAVV